MLRKIPFYLRQLKYYLLLGKRIEAHGNFTVKHRRHVSFGNRCSINDGVFILGHCQIEIGDNVTLSANCMLIDSGLDIESPVRMHTNGFIKIEDGAWIGAGAIILPDVVIGRGSVVGAGSIVTRSVPPFTVVAGNPARIIRHLTPAENNESNR